MAQRRRPCRHDRPLAASGPSELSSRTHVPGARSATRDRAGRWLDRVPGAAAALERWLAEVVTLPLYGEPDAAALREAVPRLQVGLAKRR